MSLAADLAVVVVSGQPAEEGTTRCVTNGNKEKNISHTSRLSVLPETSPTNLLFCPRDGTCRVRESPL